MNTKPHLKPHLYAPPHPPHPPLPSHPTPLRHALQLTQGIYCRGQLPPQEHSAGQTSTPPLHLSLTSSLPLPPHPDDGSRE
ncbi:hypothetical protein E2C01_052197 [Portunus trituberculatus]|uniref:Uncharacterized protein n=1 Tax=Portunus trituberculatus TaxID=210409 RepID=A0A5B7GGX1_PORTR|nr:hypothetical protein [Portunus trituberculatus]